MQVLIRQTNRPLVYLILFGFLLALLGGIQLSRHFDADFVFGLPGVSSEQIHSWLTTHLVAEQRAVNNSHISTLLVWDTVFPFGISLLFITLIACGVRSIQTASDQTMRRWSNTAILGAAIASSALLVDVSENLNIVLLLSGDNQSWGADSIWIKTLLLLTNLKWLLFSIAGLMSLAAATRLVHIALPLLFHLRLPIIVVAFGAILALSVDQIMELFFTLLGDGYTRTQSLGWAYFMTILLSFSVWFTGRTMFRFKLASWGGSQQINEHTRNNLNMLRQWLPRILGTAVPVLMAFGCFIASATLDSGSGFLIAYGVAFLMAAVTMYLFFRLRRGMAMTINRRFKPLSWMVRGVKPIEQEEECLTTIRELPASSRWFIIFMLAANVIAMFVSAWAPSVLTYVGPIGIVLLSGTFLTISGSVLTFFAARWRFPILTFLFIVATTLHFAGVNDNHHVIQCRGMDSTQLASDCPYDPAEPIPLSPDFDRVLLDQTKNDDPIFLVSASGGGIRAAAWTAMVLADLEDQSNGRFSNYMLFGSGVSGGSLGLSTYAALLKARPDSNTNISDAARRALADDFLTPNLVKLMFADLAQRFIPAAVFTDRGQALEESWQRSFAAAAPMINATGNPMAAPFADLYSQTSNNIPYLFLNATMVQNGFRVIQHPFKPIGEFGSRFPAALDSALCLQPTTPLSAVTHNSARFTYISPAGTINNCKLDSAPGIRLENEHNDLTSIQVVDGGYFENSGTETLYDLYSAALRYGISPRRLNMIHISNDVSVANFTHGEPCNPALSNMSRSGEVTAPFSSILKTRQARGANARGSLPGAEPAADPDQPLDCQSQLYHFRLCEPNQDEEAGASRRLPLGWTLAAGAFDELRQQLSRQQHIRECIVGKLPEPS